MVAEYRRAILPRMAPCFVNDMASANSLLDMRASFGTREFWHKRIYHRNGAGSGFFWSPRSLVGAASWGGGRSHGANSRTATGIAREFHICHGYRVVSDIVPGAPALNTLSWMVGALADAWLRDGTELRFFGCIKRDHFKLTIIRGDRTRQLSALSVALANLFVR